MNTPGSLPRAVLAGVLLSALTLVADDGLRVDPPAAKASWTVEPKLKVSAPKSFFDPEVTFADFGPFVAIGLNRDATDKRLVVNLTTGKTVGTVPGKQITAPPAALSADGKLFAIGKAFGAKANGATVFDTATGKAVANVVTPAKPDKLWFAGAGKVLVQTAFPKQGFAVHDAANGKELVAIPLKDAFVGRIVAVSPGGSFVAYETGEEIVVTDLKSGEAAKALKIPPSKQLGTPRCEGLAFSPDGEELAGYFTDFQTPVVIRWALKDGSLIANSKIDAPTRPFTEFAKIEYSADGAALMVMQELVVERNSGKTLYRLAADLSARTPRKLVAASTVLDMPAAFGQPNRDIVVVSQDKDKIAKLIASFGKGLAAVDALLAPTKAVVMGKVEAVDIPLAAGAWQHKPAAGPDLGQIARRGIPLTIKGNEIDSILVAGGKKPSAVLETVVRNGFAPVDDTAVRTVVRIDLTTGKEVCRIELPPGLKLSSISADGERAATVESGPTAKRVDVWDLTAGKHVVGLRPGEKETDAKRGRPAFAGFSPSGKLITVTDGGTAASWTVPGCAANWMLSLNEFAAPVIDPSGRLLAGFSRDGIRLFDLETGDNVGDLLPSFNQAFNEQSPRTVAFRADGKQAAAIMQKGPGQNSLVSWDLSTGKVAGEFALPPVYGLSTRLKYAEGGLLLIDERDLIDPKLKETVWTYTLNTFMGKAAARTPDDRLWYAVSNLPDQPATLLAATVPDPETLERIRTVSTGPGSLIKPGERISIDLDFKGSYAAGGASKTLESLKQVYASRGLKVVEGGGDIVVSIRAVEKPTKEVISYRSMGSPFGSKLTGTEVPVIEIEFSSVASMAGSTIWEVKPQKLDLRRFSSSFVRLPQGATDMTKHLHETFWQSGPASASINALPRFLAKTPTGMVSLPGASMLTATGVQAVGK